jgi:hypothetical protein
VPTSAEMKSQMAVLAKARSASLQERSFEELDALPECETEEISVLGKPVSLTTFRSNQSVDQLLIVVQAFRETLFGITAQIYVDGFVVSASGEKVNATEEMLWDYD